MTVVTLTTDFGAGDYGAGLLHGVIYSIAPTADIIDLTHGIPPQNVLVGALALERSTRFFPAGSVHVVVVDPGVGTARRPVALRAGDQLYVGPDNGVFTRVLENCEQAGQSIEAVCLDRPEYWLTEVSKIFHGRDIFAPVGGHLAAGVPLAALGSPAGSLQRLALPHPVSTARGWQGHIVLTDHFGNLSTNLRGDQVAGRAIQIHAGGEIITGLSKTFGDRPVGELAALVDSSGYLCLAVCNGSAAKRLGLHSGDPFDLIYTD